MAAVKISNLYTTWNTASVNYAGIKLNIIDTTSSATSRLIDLQIDSGSMFYVGKTGQVVANSFSGSLVGTASFATSASYAPSSGGTTLVTGSTYPITSSWANNVISASFSTSASYALSASYATASTTASYALSASYVLDPLVGAPRNTSITGSGVSLYIDNWYVATSASFVLVASAQGAAPLYYQWFLNNTSSFLLQQSTQSFYSCSLATKSNHSGSYLCNITNSLGSCTSTPYPLRVIDRVYISGSNGPSDTTPTINSTVDFHVTASGDELTYRWKRLDNSGVEYDTEDGTPSILNSGSVTPGLHIQAITSPTAEGRYFCRVTNPLGYLTSSKMLIYLSAPTIITQPYDITSSGVTHVEATGSDIRYEWQYGNIPISGQITASLNVGDLMIAGTYTQNDINRGDKFRCRVYNDVGSVYSRDVSFRPFKIGFLEIPDSSTTRGYNNVELNVATAAITQVSGSGPTWGYGNFRYDNNTSFTWYRNGTNVGADTDCWGNTTPVLTLNNVQISDQGQYVCSASHSSGSASSDIMNLTVNAAADGLDTTPESLYLYDEDSYLLKYTCLYNSSGFNLPFSTVPEGFYRVDSAWRRSDFNTSSAFGPQQLTLLVTGSTLPEWPYSDSFPTSTHTVYGSGITGSFQIWKFQRVKFERQPGTNPFWPAEAQPSTPWAYMNMNFEDYAAYSSSYAAGSTLSTVTLYKMVNPSLVSHPTASISASLGTEVNIISSGTGSSIQYQWYKDH